MILSDAFRYFTVAGFINAVVLSVLLLLNKKNHLAKLFMISIVVLNTFQALLNAFDTREFFLAYPHLSKISWLTPSLFGPLVFLFTVKLCSYHPVFRRIDLLHFIPFTVYLALLLPWYLKTADEKRAYLDNFELASMDDFGILNQVSLLLILVYLLATLRYLKHFRKTIQETFSEISRKRVEWMSTFAYAVLAILIISALGFYGHKWQIPVLDAIYHYNYFLVILLVYWIAYKALLQPVIFDIPIPAGDPRAEAPVAHTETVTAIEPEARKYTRSGLDDIQSELMYGQLVSYVKKNKPYLNPEINIYQLAGLLDMKKHHLSRIINEKAGMNFFDFINAFRVEEIKKNLADNTLNNLTLLGIALESGFNSKATFNAAFKKFTGLTPSEFQKNLKNQV
jgi:AraC-like DNA-binding protein